MSKQSAGLLLFRRHAGTFEVLIGHMGGPFFAKKDNGAWSIPKGEFDDEDALDAAKREFQEETQAPAPEGKFIELGNVKNKSGKTIYIWAVEADINATILRSNVFKIEWPPKSGQQQEFPEMDRYLWTSLRQARSKLVSAQAEFIDRLSEHLGILSDTEKTDQPDQTSLL